MSLKISIKKTIKKNTIKNKYLFENLLYIAEQKRIEEQNKKNINSQILSNLFLQHSNKDIIDVFCKTNKNLDLNYDLLRTVHNSNLEFINCKICRENIITILQNDILIKSRFNGSITLVKIFSRRYEKNTFATRVFKKYIQDKETLSEKLFKYLYRISRHVNFDEECENLVRERVTQEKDKNEDLKSIVKSILEEKEKKDILYSYIKN